MEATLEQTRPWGYEELLAIPADGKRYEIVSGRAFELPRPSFLHQFTLTKLERDLAEFVVPRKLGLVFSGEITVRLDHYQIFRPDIILLRPGHGHRVDSLIRENFVDGSPDLIVEVVNEATEQHDYVRKSAIYPYYGVREYWLADLERKVLTVRVRRNEVFEDFPQSDGLVRSELLPGCVIDPRGYFDLPNWFVSEDPSDS